MGIPQCIRYMEPTLLFSVVKDGKKSGVYYVSQYGVVMEGVNTEGSVVTLAKNLAKLNDYTIESAEINIEDLTIESVVQSICHWLEPKVDRSENSYEEHEEYEYDDV